MVGTVHHGNLKVTEAFVLQVTRMKVDAGETEIDSDRIKRMEDD